MMRRVEAAWLALLLLGGTVGCSSKPLMVPAQPAPLVVEPSPSATPDSARLKDALTGREMSPSEVANLSDRLLEDGSQALDNQQTMARLELVILKALNVPGRDLPFGPMAQPGHHPLPPAEIQAGGARSAIRQRTQPQERSHPFLPGLPFRPQGQDLRQFGQDQGLTAAV